MNEQKQKIYPLMREIAIRDYLNFLKEHEFVIVENQKVKLCKQWEITKLGPSEEYKSEGTTVWSFPNRGNWATHIGDIEGTR